LPYGRIADRNKFWLVLDEGRRTCTTKHALLSEVAREHPRAGGRLDCPRLRVARFSGSALTEGIERHREEGVEMRVYSEYRAASGKP